MTNENIKVTVYCMAFNQEAFIRDALEGFVNQETDFAFEVLVHDDASTDGTAQIIREYAQRYPEVIVPILQEKNQYSQGVNIMYTHLIPRTRGKYVAICEGDDYWTDNQKLQKQYDYMESHPDCTFCFTNALVHDETAGTDEVFVPRSEADKKRFDPGKTEYDLHDFYLLSFIPTASYFFPFTDLDAVKEAWLKPCPTGDLKWRLYLTSRGYAHFINENCCVYRVNVQGSDTTRWQKEDRHAAVNRHRQVLEMLQDLDEATGRKFHDGLLKFMLVQGYWLLTNMSQTEMKEEMKQPQIREIYQHLSLSEKMKVQALTRRNNRI